MSQPRSGRIFQYSGEVPYDTDLLWSNLYRMVDVSNLARTLLGTGLSNATLAAGITCTQSSPPALSVDLGPGVMYVYVEQDSTAYSSIPAELAVNYKLYKQFTFYGLSGFGLGTFVAPVSGATNFLIQAIEDTNDDYVTARPYFNPADPDAPFTHSRPYVRQDTIEFSVKSATSPSIPTPDAGKIGLYVISVASGQSTITSGDISVYSGAPFITESLTQKISQTTADARYLRAVTLQASTPIFGNDTGVANAYLVTATPAYTAVGNGSIVYMKAANTNTTDSGLNVSGLGITPIRVQTVMGLQALVGNEIRSGQIYQLMNNGTYWILMNPSRQIFYSESVYRSAAQSIPGNNVPTLVQWDTVDYSNSYGTITFSGTPDYKMTVNVAGFIDVNSIIRYIGAAVSSNTVLYLEVFKNGVSYQRLNQVSANTADITPGGCIRIPMAVGDYVQIMAVNNTGTARNIGDQTSNVFQVNYVGA